MEEGGAIVLRARWPLSFMARISVFVLAWLSLTFLALLISDFSVTQAFLSVTFLALLMGVAYGRRTVRFDHNSCLLLNNWKRGRGAVQLELDHQSQTNFEEDQATKRWRKKMEEMMRMEAADKLRRQNAKKVELEDPVRMCLEGNAAFKAGNWRRQDYFSTQLPPIMSLSPGPPPCTSLQLRCRQRLTSAWTSSPSSIWSAGPHLFQLCLEITFEQEPAWEGRPGRWPRHPLRNHHQPQAMPSRLPSCSGSTIPKGQQVNHFPFHSYQVDCQI